LKVGSHYHLIETNPNLRFDRALAYGRRLNIPSGTAVRFEPGESKTVQIVDIEGNKIISGGNNLATGKVNRSLLDSIISNIQTLGFSHELQTDVKEIQSPFLMDRRRYVASYGPTTGDKIRLADTNLWAEIEYDFTVYGDECVFGGGKTIREGMGQATGITDKDALDLVITNAAIIDYTGIYKVKIIFRNFCMCCCLFFIFL